MFATARRSSAVKALYDSVLKEAQRTAETGPLVSYLQKQNNQSADSSSRGSDYHAFIAPSKTAAEIQKQNLENLHVFLRNKALHSELLQRYNPTTDMTEEERVRLTARRVGLDVPITHDSASESSSATANNYRESAQIAQDQYKQDKDNRQGQLYSGKGDGSNVGGPLRPPGSKE